MLDFIVTAENKEDKSFFPVVCCVHRARAEQYISELHEDYEKRGYILSIVENGEDDILTKKEIYNVEEN